MSILKNKETRSVLLLLGFLGFLVLGSVLVEFNIIDILYLIAIIYTICRYIYLHRHGSVSYTHLDVYKRQIHNSVFNNTMSISDN